MILGSCVLDITTSHLTPAGRSLPDQPKAYYAEVARLRRLYLGEVDGEGWSYGSRLRFYDFHPHKQQDRIAATPKLVVAGIFMLKKYYCHFDRSKRR
ncbi:MAG: hypothetical protein DRP93_01485 [Candidatus Neomarinimicrobiota bacterium]|nr:MAG: hypothetical protein DRP93_01485 [Candidatus Neomarinimicrobiota bacterium]